MGILGLFRLNGAFLLLPSILSFLVVMTVILDHSIIIFLRVGGIFFSFLSCIHMELEILQRRYHCNEDI